MLSALIRVIATPGNNSVTTLFMWSTTVFFGPVLLWKPSNDSGKGLGVHLQFPAVSLETAVPAEDHQLRVMHSCSPGNGKW